MVSAVTFLVLWTLVIAGGLPTSTQRDLEARFAWWHPRLFGLVSALVEFLGGLGVLRQVFILSGLDRLGTGEAVVPGFVGMFMLVEGVLRFGITPRLEGVAVPSLPVVVAARVLGRLSGPA